MPRAMTAAWLLPATFLLFFSPRATNEHCPPIESTATLAANCSSGCGQFRRQWPQLDFEFYPEQSGAGVGGQHHSLPPQTPPSHSSQPEPTVPITISPSFTLQSTIATNPGVTRLKVEPFHTVTNGSGITGTGTALTNHNRKLPSLIDLLGSNCTERIERGSAEGHLIEDYLLRSVFKNKRPHQVDEQLERYFRDKLTRLYEYGMKKQRDELAGNRTSGIRKLLSLDNTSVDLNVWDLQVDSGEGTVDVIYYVHKDGVLLPYEDAAKVMSFVPIEMMANVTGYDVVHRVQPYNTLVASRRQSMLNVASILAIVILLLLFIALLLVFYLCYRREKQRWLESINRDLNRVMPSSRGQFSSRRNSSRASSADSGGHWNYGHSDSREDGCSQSGLVDRPERIDKGSQCDFETAPSSEEWLQKLSPPPQAYNERLIPISNVLGKHLDYDKISYMRSLEKIEETQKHPNILEIRLSEETQSIVKEIRKELNRYSLRKIIANDNSTSDA